MSEAGKGDALRPVDREKFRRGWDRVFGRQKVTDETNGSNQQETQVPGGT